MFSGTQILLTSLAPSTSQYERGTRDVYKKYSHVKIEHFTFQRDEKTEDGDEVYLYYQMNNKWRFANGPNFRAKTTTCWMYFESSGKK